MIVWFVDSSYYWWIVLSMSGGLKSMSLGSNYGGARFALDRSFSELLVYVYEFREMRGGKKWSHFMMKKYFLHTLPTIVWKVFCKWEHTKVITTLFLNSRLTASFIVYYDDISGYYCWYFKFDSSHETCSQSWVLVFRCVI